MRTVRDSLQGSSLRLDSGGSREAVPSRAPNYMNLYAYLLMSVSCSKEIVCSSSYVYYYSIGIDAYEVSRSEGSYVTVYVIPSFTPLPPPELVSDPAPSILQSNPHTDSARMVQLANTPMTPIFQLSPYPTPKARTRALQSPSVPWTTSGPCSPLKLQLPSADLSILLPSRPPPVDIGHFFHYTPPFRRFQPGPMQQKTRSSREGMHPCFLQYPFQERLLPRDSDTHRKECKLSSSAIQPSLHL